MYLAYLKSAVLVAGRGIPAKVEPHFFNPSFTLHTKLRGKITFGLMFVLVAFYLNLAIQYIYG